MNNYLKNYVEAYENHFKNDKRNDATFEQLQYAGWLLDKYCGKLNIPTWYKGAYEFCKKYLAEVK